MKTVERRKFLQAAAAAAGAIATGARVGAREAPLPRARPIRDVVLDLQRVRKWDTSNGDTWDPFVSDDGRIYSFNCDGRGFGALGRNASFNRIDGILEGPLGGANVNPMDEYGESNLHGPDNATWKIGGQMECDGAMYAFVSRETYGKESGDRALRQTAANSSLIRSADRGRTWHRTAQQNYDRPMWPGRLFALPAFVRNVHGGTLPDDEGFLYAVSTDGFWNNGDELRLGRVHRSRIALLDPSDWEYCRPGAAGIPPTWVRDISASAPILSAAGKCGQPTMALVPGTNRWLTVLWYVEGALPSWFAPVRMRYDFYEAPAPWGPWTEVASYDDAFLGDRGNMYGPALSAIGARPEGDAVRLSLFTSGCQFEDARTGLYKVWEIPILVRTNPPLQGRRLEPTDVAVVTKGSWHVGSREPARYRTEAIHTWEIDASAQLAFEGTGIDILSERDISLGICDVELDGRPFATLDQRILNFPRIAPVTALRIRGLEPKAHTLRIVNRTGDCTVLAGFVIYT